MSKKIKYLIVLLLVLMLALTACGGGANEEDNAGTEDNAAAENNTTENTAENDAAASEDDAAAVTELNILWAQWDPADYLQQVANLYEAETGIKVNVIQEPWGSFGDRFFTEMAAQGDAWDMVIGDSQWLGQGATQGHYLELTDFMVSEGIAETVTPATLTYYGEYPTGSGKYWAFPTEGDADGWAYRKDLFENPDEMAAFQEQYGYELAPPENYQQLMDIAQFFTRPDQGLYGVGIYTQKDYDALTMGVENTMFAWGASWQDENNNVMGVVNSPEAIEAVEFYRQLYECCQAPGLSNAFFAETNDAFISGQAVMIMNYFAFFPALVNPATNPDHAANTGFFPNPAGPTGERGAALGGQGISVISYISPERQEAAKAFIKWFAEEETQAEWARLGGYTCNINILQTEEFLNAAPYNPAFAETMTFVKDFWNIPVFGELLEVSQRELSEYIVEGQGTAEEAMNAIAEEHDRILREAEVIE
jgi:multiple sugar transport system substrate-binding protein